MKMVMENLKLSTSKQHYWENTGAYQKEMDRLTEKLMPDMGCADTLNGELIRAANRLYYEFCNNGNCNAGDYDYVSYDDEPEDFGYQERYITRLFRDFIHLLKDFFKTRSKEAFKEVCEVEGIMLNGEDVSDRSLNVYDHVVDYVVYFVLQNEDDKSPLPSWYKNN